MINETNKIIDSLGGTTALAKLLDVNLIPSILIKGIIFTAFVILSTDNLVSCNVTNDY